MILAGAALMALVACNKSETVNTEAAKDSLISFKAVTNVMTKTDHAQLEGTTLGSSNDKVRMFVSATTHTANGAVQNADYFSARQFGYNGSTSIWIPGTPTAATTTGESAIYWPLGGSTVDFLAWAVYNVTGDNTDYTSIFTVPAPTWPLTNKADQVKFTDLDMFSKKVDVMYAAANAQKGLDNATPNDYRYVPLVFHHAGAVIDLNIESNLAITINEVKFGNLVTEKGTFETNEYATLDKVGTLTVDNTKTILSAEWTGVDQGTTATYSTLVPFDDGVTTLADKWAGVALTAGTQKADRADVIVMPQPKLNFIIKYTDANSKEFYVTAPVTKGNWLAGHKYIYNVDITFQKIEVHESVIDYTVEGAVDGDENIPLS